jgi:sugar lactone lactonase YvrE
MSRRTPPSRLFGANGLRTGPDGRVYVAQVTGSQISAVDPVTGALETVSARGGEIIAPDDVAFTATGELVATEVMDGRVSVRSADGRSTRVLRDDLPSANGITVHQGRLFIGECRAGGRLMELDPHTGEQRLLIEDVPMPNAMEVGPDGWLYYPAMGSNDIWRIHPDGGEPQRVAGDLGVPDSVKFDSAGRIVSTQVATGEVLRIDPRNGERTVLARLSPGLDNCTFVGDRLFASNFTGEITEILAGGGTRTLLPGGLNWPLDLTVDRAGTLHVADGTFSYGLRDLDGEKGQPEVLGMLFTPGYPGFVRGIQSVGESGQPGAEEFLVATSGGQIARWWPREQRSEILADGYDQLYGIAVGPGGAIACAELGTGRLLGLRPGSGGAGAAGVEVLAGGLDRPVGVACAPDGTVLVAESGAGRISAVRGGRTDTLLDGLDRPQGILLYEGRLLVVDAGAKTLLSIGLDGGVRGDRQVIAEGLPVGPPPGVQPKPLLGMPPFSGPQGPFAGLAAAPDGTVYLSADGEGSVLAFHRTADTAQGAGS